MASHSRAFLSLMVFLSVSLALVVHTSVGARNIPADAKLEPEWFGHYDRSVLIPGIGRVMLPPKGSHLNFNYNPITGSPNGNGVSIPRVGGGDPAGSGSPRNYVPGGDDTLLPNPGVEVPNPSGGTGSRVPTPSGH
ncbi:hypothetical protein ABFS82_08G108400 [Erythranthe guttata]|uniref:Cell wall protein n=1 Tax=Erythranthe guttata TaxID=4155 RepID=A0A022QI04_ERYGU|nr:hypothetical protein MIMGU_mgv1a016067mg [Erythranthe guttata]